MKNSKYNIWLALIYEVTRAITEYYPSLRGYKVIRMILSYCKHDWVLWKIESTLISVDKDVEKITKEWDKNEKPKTIYSELPPDGSKAQDLLGGEMRIRGNFETK
jgi:hypothetical protein